ncbi:acetyltransferase, partial [Candidatus Bipolaricaulota bacterium]|nr:acetyltransferase [Candidatus Bipolaricaulota bacterium]
EIQHTSILGIPVIGDESVLKSPDWANCVMVVAIGDNALRASIADRLASLGRRFAVVRHPASTISPSATLGEGTVVLAGVVINSMATIGRHCIVNTMASIDHDCSLADFVHVSPGSHLAGHCRIGEMAHIGIGACMLPNLSVGHRSTIGGGAVVTTDIPGDAIAVGVPAKVVQ